MGRSSSESSQTVTLLLPLKPISLLIAPSSILIQINKNLPMRISQNNRRIHNPLRTPLQHHRLPLTLQIIYVYIHKLINIHPFIKFNIITIISNDTSEITFFCSKSFAPFSKLCLHHRWRLSASYCPV